MTIPQLTETFLQGHPLPDLSEGGGKQTRGQVLIVGGSRQVPGAILLAALSALRAGAGILQIATVKSVAIQLALTMPEAMVIGCNETPDGDIASSAAGQIAKLAANCNAVLLGPGMLDAAAAGELAKQLLQGGDGDGPSIVLDAAAFTSLRNSSINFEAHAGRLVSTPHAGEMATFLGAEREIVENDMLAAGRRAAATTRGVVAMKGAETYVVAPDGAAFLSQHGSIALATSGSGDTLAGLLAGLLARGADPLTATLWAVYVHAQAGVRLENEYGPLGGLARELPDFFPAIINSLSSR
jgi:ADP-dependent NAD(P)H-hydrate dehydratase